MTKVVSTLLLVLVLLARAAVVGGWFLLGRGISARGEPGSLETFVARRLRHLAVPRGARNARNPVASSPEVLADGRAHFADHCATCHANDGSGRTEIGQGLYPKPPDMRIEATQGLSDGELFYIIRNGIRFTGMPGWAQGPEGGSRHLGPRPLRPASPEDHPDELEEYGEAEPGGPERGERTDLRRGEDPPQPRLPGLPSRSGSSSPRS